MKIRSLSVKNFRGLEDISFTCRPNVKALVIAGPNAVGKSTILEALRLLKSMLCPVFSNERQTTLQDMGCFSPARQSVDFSSLCRDMRQELRISAAFDISQREVGVVEQMENEWARRRVGESLGLGPDEAQMRLVGYLSSTEGKRHVQREQEGLRKEISRLKAELVIQVGLVLDPTTGGVHGTNRFSQDVVWALDRSNQGYHGLFNYFPADRSMPTGEVTVQLGSAEYTHQLKSYIAQPATKYQRMKNFLISRYLMGDEERKQTTGDFEAIFSRLIRGKKLDSIRVSQRGRVQIMIRDADSSATYDIDRMSSGEKGLLLTAFMIMRTTAQGGIVLFDEPELHLNSSVCQALIPYLAEEVVPVFDGQIVMCTHSQDLLVSASLRDDCELFHLRSGRNISKIERQDTEEVSEALAALGASSTDVLFTRGTLFVEGVDDEAVLEEMFSEELSGFKITVLGGRGEVEKHILALQKDERQAGGPEVRYGFVFDLDRKPTKVSSSDNVKVEQWKRYCLENYLLNPDAIYDVLKSLKRNNADAELNRGEVARLLKVFAMKQTTFLAVKKSYATREPDNPGLRASELGRLDNVENMVRVLAERLWTIKEQLRDHSPTEWKATMIAEANARTKELAEDWESNWKSKCDGKGAIMAVFKHYSPQCKPRDFKVRVAKRLKERSSEEFDLIRSTLSRVLPTSPEIHQDL